MKQILDDTFKNNLVSGATVSATNEKNDNSASNILDQNENTYWTTQSGIDTTSLIFILPDKQTFNVVQLQ